MIYLFAFLTALPAETLHVRATLRDAPVCQMTLTPTKAGVGEFNVTRLRLSGGARTPLLLRAATGLGLASLGRAWDISPIGVRNYFDNVHGNLLDAFVTGRWGFAPNILDAILEARDAWSDDERAVASHALGFVRGREPGVAYGIDHVASLEANAVQGQTTLLVLPEATYPRGVLVSFHGCLPAHRYLANVNWIDADLGPRSAVLLPATIEDNGGRRPKFFVTATKAREHEAPGGFVRATCVE